MIELLAPAGSLDSLRAAVNAGADAVYIGGSMFGARAYADNPDEEHLLSGIEYCHLHGRKIYMTVNTLLKERELHSKIYPFLLPYYESGVDGLIVQDLGVVRFVQEHFPGLDVHASTQMTVTGVSGARLLQRAGITRVVPARELSLSVIHNIIEETGMEVETFIHGAMCYCYSGQCLFSSMLGGRSGNRGRCAQPCRLPYHVEGGTKKSAAPYLLSMKDMCTLDLIPELIDAGIASLKIEGRMKRPEYTAGVVAVYRKYIDLYRNSGRGRYRVDEEDRKILLDLYNRGGFSGGYYHTTNGRSMMAMDRPNHLGTQAAKVLAAGKGKLRARALEKLGKNDVLELAGQAETTVTGEVQEGAEFTLAYSGPLPASGSVIYRTKNDSLLQELNRKYVQENCREKIKGELKIFRGSPAILKLVWRDISVTVSGTCAQEAVSNPATQESVRRQMMKTGNTPFVLEHLDISLDDGLFVTVRDLNALRREGIEQLESAILEKSRRTAELPQRTCTEKKSEKNTEYKCVENISGEMGRKETASAENVPVGSRKKICTNILVTTPEQLEAVLGETELIFDTVYFDSLLVDDCAGEKKLTIEALADRLKERGSRCFFFCPPVLRSMDLAFLNQKNVRKFLRQMDGFLIHTIDQLEFFRNFVAENNMKAELAGDYSLYAYNSMAAEFLQSQGISRRTLPAELNQRELMQLDREHTELEIYGYQPLMQSAQCVQKNTGGCTKKPGILYLRDRKKTSFPVRNRCCVCCNTIYNSVPLKLVGCREEILQVSPAYVRLSFTIEDYRETAAVLKQYEALLWELYNGTASDDCMQTASDGTRGHFKRGVE